MRTSCTILHWLTVFNLFKLLQKYKSVYETNKLVYWIWFHFLSCSFRSPTKSLVVRLTLVIQPLIGFVPYIYRLIQTFRDCRTVIILLDTILLNNAITWCYSTWQCYYLLLLYLILLYQNATLLQNPSHCYCSITSSFS
jgi:hypothetical protein